MNTWHRVNRYRSTLALIVAGSMAAGLVACGGGNEPADGSGSGDSQAEATLTMYSGQHEDFSKALVAAFEESSGIHIDLRPGDDAELTNQIIEEGDRSKADIVLTEEPGPMGQLSAEGLLAEVDADTEAVPDQRFVPEKGDWLPFAGRSRVIFYDPDQIEESDLPASILDLEDPKWKDRFAYAPSGAFTGTVSYLINTIGSDDTLDWLEAIKANGINEQKNGNVRDSVEAGQHEFGLANHYYWYILAKDEGAGNLRSRVHYMGDQDAGALVFASAAGVLRSSEHQEEAQEFLSWLASPEGGQAIVAGDTPQYPMTPGVQSSYDLLPLEQLDPPVFDQGSLSDVNAAKDLMLRAGIV